MKRRKFLFGVGTVAVASISGCTSPSDSESTPSGTTEQPERETATVTDSSFTKISPKEATQEPTVTHNDAENTITVQGIVTVPDGCTTVSLKSSPSITAAETITAAIKIGTKPTDDAEQKMCTQALREIGYEVTFTYEGTAIEQVTVEEAGVEPESHTVSVSTDT